MPGLRQSGCFHFILFNFIPSLDYILHLIQLQTTTDLFVVSHLSTRGLWWECERVAKHKVRWGLLVFFSSYSSPRPYPYSHSQCAISQWVFIKTCWLRREALIKSHLFVCTFEETPNNCCVKMHTQKWFRADVALLLLLKNTPNVMSVNDPVLYNEFHWRKLKYFFAHFGNKGQFKFHSVLYGLVWDE